MVEMPGSVSAKKMITSYPVLFGALIALLLSGAIMVVVIWFPWIGEYHDGHKTLVQAVLFTAIYFMACGVGGAKPLSGRPSLCFFCSTCWASSSIPLVLGPSLCGS